MLVTDKRRPSNLVPAVGGPARCLLLACLPRCVAGDGATALGAMLRCWQSTARGRPLAGVPHPCPVWLAVSLGSEPWAQPVKA